MELNPKKPMRMKNRTKYFDPERSRTHVEFSSPASYQSRSIKIEGYETRLYWQWKYCQDHNGQVFFYTLTYNDKAKPTYYGQPCFDYMHLRELLTGGFNKILLRRYGTKLKYFIGAELGDGKGERGFHCNPHYHALFFLEPDNSGRYTYYKISPEDFRHLVRLYWQGFDQETDGWHDFKKAKYGIACEGDKTGLVYDFRACMYVAKYVCKDVKLKAFEEELKAKLKFIYTRKYRKSKDFHMEFFHTYIYDTFNHRLNSKGTAWLWDDHELLAEILRKDYEQELFKEYISYYKVVKQIVEKYCIHDAYENAFKAFIDSKVKESINEYRNRYCNKCRISNGIGDYALDYIEDKMNPTIQVPGKNGFKNRPISQYYYRKLYTDVHKDKKGMNIRVLNELGQRYKSESLDRQLKKVIEEAETNLGVLNNELYTKMLKSDVNTCVFMEYGQFNKYLDNLKKNESLTEILEKYAEFKLVYKDRYFHVAEVGYSDDSNFPIIDVHSDYLKFLCPTYFTISRSDLRLDAFLESNDTHWIPYSAHTYFLRYYQLFNVLDLVADYLFIQEDDRRQREAERIAEIKRFHDRKLLKEYFRLATKKS